jgi:hypothetical protein
MVIELNADKSLLKILFEEERFCSMYFFDGDYEHYLGQDLSLIVLSRLIEAFEKRLPLAGNIKNVNVAWVLSMPDAHSTLYLEISDSSNQTESRKIFFEDKHGKLIGFLDVESSELSLWIESLRRMRGFEESRVKHEEI